MSELHHQEDVEKRNHRVDSGWNMRNKKMLEEMAKEKTDRRLNKVCIGDGSRTWIQYLVTGLGSVIPFATHQAWLHQATVDFSSKAHSKP